MAIHTATQADLGTAWAALKDGDTLKLSGKIGPWRPAGRKFATPIVIDLANAELTDFYSGSIEGLCFVGGLVRPGPTYRTGIRLANSANISFVGVKFVGTGTDYGSWDTALWLEYCRDVTIDSIDVRETVLGVKLHEVDRAVVKRSTFRRLKTDGLNLYGVRDAIVEDNDFAEFLPPAGAHPDAIQALTNAGKPKTARITVRRNKIAGKVQGIFFGAGAAETGFEDIEISDNTVEAGYPNGIYASWTNGLKLLRNRVSTLAGTQYRSDIKAISCSNVTRSGNYVEGYNGAGPTPDADYVPPAPAPTPSPTPPPDPNAGLRVIQVKAGERFIIEGI